MGTMLKIKGVLFYSLMQNNISPNFSDELNFVTCEHSLTLTETQTLRVNGPLVGF